MQKEKNRGKQKRDVLPEEFASISEAASFWESHDSTDYEDIMEEVEFEVDIKRRKYLFALDAGVARKLSEIAKSRKITSEALANAWLIEKIKEQTSSNQQL